MQTTPFKRASIMRMAVLNILSTVAPSLQAEAIASLGQYRSRGHGKCLPSKHYNRTTSWKTRGVLSGCGKRECSRRVRQMQRRQS